MTCIGQKCCARTWSIRCFRFKLIFSPSYHSKQNDWTDMYSKDTQCKSNPLSPNSQSGTHTHTHTQKSQRKQCPTLYWDRKISVFNKHLQVYFYQCKRKHSNSTFCFLLFIQLLHRNSQTLQRCYFGYLILSYTHLSLMDICLADMMSESSSPSSVLKSVSCSSSLLLSSERCPADSVYVCGAREPLCKKDEPCDTAAAARTVAVCTGRSVKHQHRKGLEQPQWYNQ